MSCPLDATYEVLVLNVKDDGKRNVAWRDECKDNMKDGCKISPYHLEGVGQHNSKVGNHSSPTCKCKDELSRLHVIKKVTDTSNL